MPKRVLAASVLICSVFLLSAAGEEGMYPITELPKLNLKAKGLRIDPASIYNPKGGSLVEAVVHLGGCSASFVSNDGLILTNHHCVFGGVQALSTPEQDYLTNGLLAATRADEIPARGMTARITEQVRDVTAEVMGAVTPGMDSLTRAKAIDDRIGQLTKKAQVELPGKTVGISEMLAGKSYVMFISTTFRDMRFVYVPPRGTGEFGGEDDNWVWPRHTGDFSFVRAYAAPDGKPADYSASNVPYHPKRFLRVNPNGVNEEDFIFILGYPGRTYRHQTSSYLAYEEDHRMPFIASHNAWQIATMEALGKESRATALRFDSRIKGLANTMKNYRGKLAGMKRLQLTAKRRAEEAGLQKFIDADPARQAAFGNVLADTDKIYAEMSARAQYELVLDALPNTSTLLRLGATVAEAASETAKPGAQRQGASSEEAFAASRKAAARNLANYHEGAERLFFARALSLAAGLPADQRIGPVDEALKGDFSEKAIAAFVDDAFSRTMLTTPEGLAKASGQAAEGDPFVSLARALAPLQQQLREVRQRRTAELSRLAALLIDVKQAYLQKDFIPDANSTLRFTYGRIRGYSPSDAVVYRPITTLTGVMEKTGDEYPYLTPQAVRDLYAAKDFGRYRLPKSNDLPVGILYNADTTGGNSGSPVMNAMGELVGINFDRAWEATINDYAWNEAYSRSIAVDIRYVLWMVEKVAKAHALLEEMGVTGGKRTSGSS